MGNSNEIIKQRNRQTVLEKDIQKIKTNTPKYLITLVLASIIVIFILEEKVYHFFGNGVNFILLTITILIFSCLIYLYKNLNNIKIKEKELKKISTKLYDLMKLNLDDANK